MVANQISIMTQDPVRQYALRLLTQRPYSKSRLLFKLRQKGYEVEAEAVLAELEAKGAINDQRFAQAFVEQSQLQRPSGRQRVILALRRRGIDQEAAMAAWQKWEEAAGKEMTEMAQGGVPRVVADGVLGGVRGKVAGGSPVAAAALAAARSRYQRGDLDLQGWAARQKLLAFLNRRGFVYTEAKTALAQLLQDEGISGT